MNLKNCGGRVPIRNNSADTPYLLVDFPTKEVFHTLYSGYVPKANQDKYWDILSRRREGATLEQSGKPHAMTRERVRQIEAKFIYLMSKLHQTSAVPAVSSTPDSL
jgi:hypothetical protein